MRSGSGSATSRTMSRIFARRSAAESLVCCTSTSSICRPQVMTGLSAVIGSWNTIDMRVARSSRSRSGRAFATSSPSSRMLPPVTGSAWGSSPIIACAMTDLPEPDSPTRQTISPRSTLKDTLCTARRRSLPAGRATDRPRTSSTVLIRAWPSSGLACRAARRREC